MRILASLKNLVFKLRYGMKGFPLAFGGRTFRVDERLRRWNVAAEKPILDILRESLQTGDVYVDIGANFGLHVLVGSDAIGPEGKVFAFEPMPANLRLLKRNIQLNGYTETVTVEEAAVSNSSQKHLDLYFASSDLDVAASLTREVEGRHSVKVRNIRLDDYDLPRERPVAVLKIDVEGAEAEVLKGGTRLLQQHKPVLLIEVHTYALKDFGSSREELLGLLEGLGYEERIISFPGNKGKDHYNAIYTQKGN